MRESKVYLEPIEHVYIHKDTGQKYKSVTTVLSMLEPKFESEKIAEAIEKQDEFRKKERYKGMTKQEILDDWKRENEEANEYGTEIHEILERYLLANRIYPPKSEYERKIITALNKRITYLSEYGHWLNKPVSHLSDCQYNVYALQMSIYAYMYQMETRKKVGKLNLYYYNPDTLKFEIIHCPYMGLEAKKVLDFWLEVQNGKN
jgi:hypothetical protein